VAGSSSLLVGQISKWLRFVGNHIYRHRPVDWVVTLYYVPSLFSCSSGLEIWVDEGDGGSDHVLITVLR
jgi:hypothetical protein